MKKTLLSVAVIAATVSVAYAADATNWFNGGVGAVSGGKWSSATGVSTDDGKYVLSDVESYAFTATSPKSASEAKLYFQSNVKFQYAYGALPEIRADDKAGVTVFGQGVNTNYYVLARDPYSSSPETNMWVDTGVAANLVELIPVNIVISNGVHKTYAIYTINNNEKTYEIVAASKHFQVVDYSGSGVIGSLEGSFLLQGYPIPGNFVIATEAGNAWAARFGYAQDKLAAILINNATVAYGRTAAESCILGVATNEEITASIDDTGVAANKLKFKVQLDPTKIIAGHNVQFQLKKDATGVGSAQTDLVFNPDFAAGKYSIVAYIDGANKEISVSKTMGVKTAEGFGASAAAGFLAVPYTGAEGDIAISNLFKKAMLVNGDHLDVFDSETAGWKSFTFNGTAWEGVPKNDVTPDPATTTIKRGQAFKLTRPKVDGMSAPVYLGYVSTAAAKVSIPAGQYELVSKVDGSSFALSGMADSDWGAKVDVGAAVPTEMYKKIRGGWKKIVYADGKATAHDATEVNGPFFMLNRGTEAKEVDFSK